MPVWAGCFWHGCGCLMSHTSAREILRALCGKLAVQQAGDLADLDEGIRAKK
jgi:hypothetical protein